MNAGAIKTGQYGERRVQLAPPGCPHIIGWQKGTGRFIGIECKVGKNKRNTLQEEFAKMMITDDCIYVLAYALSDVERIL
jgi:4-aminobutyrate aminotransferase-like enzyme